MTNFLKDKKVLCALGGAAAVILGKKIITAKKTRQLAVSGLAKGMKLAHDSREVFQNMKDDAADLCYDAKAEAGIADDADRNDSATE